MNMPTEIKVTLKNIPLEVQAMIVSALRRAPLHYQHAPLEIPASGLVVDFNEITDEKMMADMIQSAANLVMAHGFLEVMRRPR